MLTTTEFEWRGATGPFTLLLSPSVFAPTSTSVALSRALRVQPNETVIDLGCGTGVLSFVAARLGAEHVIGTDLSRDAVALAEQNARRLGLDDRVEFRAGNLFDPIRDVRADVIMADVSGVPDSLAEATGWFPEGRGGGPTGAELPIAMLHAMDGHLKPHTRVYLPTATIQDDVAILSAARAIFGAEGLELVSEHSFPLPADVAGSTVVRQLSDQGRVRLTRRGSRLLWKLSIWVCVGPDYLPGGR
jgi:SAM-dependent methyltransferase